MLDHAKMIDSKLSMQYIAGRIVESFKTDLFVIWSEDNSEKFIIHWEALIRMITVWATLRKIFSYGEYHA